MRKLALLLLLLPACGPLDDEDTLPTEDVGEIPSTDEGKADSPIALHVSAGKRVSATLTSTGKPTAITVDCGVAADPDEIGATFAVTSSALGIPRSTSQPARAGYFRWVGTMDAGSHSFALTGRSGSANCKVTSVKTSAVPSEAWHSPNPNHTHFRVGTDTSSDWEPFPASGNHWGAWAPWARIYPSPLKRGFLLHNLEHGGLIFSYKCASDAGAECAAARDHLAALAHTLGKHRVIITPDPTQPAMYGIRGWRWAYTSDSFSSTAMLPFAAAHFGHGREDIDADPPIPFDPTTTHVPCQDLMAAPDSCN
jgi:hypothetical protein